MSSPLLHILWSSNWPLESLSLSSWCCNWWCMLWCICRPPCPTLKSRGPWGEGDRSSLSTPPPPPPPPKISVIINRERGGCNIAIDPRCSGTVIPLIPVVAATLDNKSTAEVPLIFASVDGLSPALTHCRTILMDFTVHPMHTSTRWVRRYPHEITQFRIKTLQCYIYGIKCVYWRNYNHKI